MSGVRHLNEFLLVNKQLDLDTDRLNVAASINQHNVVGTMLLTQEFTHTSFVRAFLSFHQ